MFDCKKLSSVTAGKRAKFACLPFQDRGWARIARMVCSQTKVPGFHVARFCFSFCHSRRESASGLSGKLRSWSVRNRSTQASRFPSGMTKEKQALPSPRVLGEERWAGQKCRFVGTKSKAPLPGLLHARNTELGILNSLQSREKSGSGVRFACGATD